MVRIKWLEEAKIDLREIYDFIARDSPRYARLQVSKIQETSKVLRNQPRIGKALAEVGSEYIRELVIGPYRLIYRVVSDKEIHVLLIHHGARNLQKRIKNI